MNKKDASTFTCARPQYRKIKVDSVRNRVWMYNEDTREFDFLYQYGTNRTYSVFMNYARVLGISPKNPNFNGDGLLEVTYDFARLAILQPSSLSFSDEIIEFLKYSSKQGCVISKMLLKASFHKIRCAPFEKMPNYVTISDDREKLVFSAPKKLPKLESASRMWSKEGRQEARPAALARKLLNPRLVKRLNDSHFNTFATKFKAFFQDVKLEFKFLPFNEGYDPSNYSNDLGSCMSVHKDKISNFYEIFPCKLLVAERHSSVGSFLVGRAIVWNDVHVVHTSTDLAGPPKLDSSGKSVQKISFMDRIYSRTPEIVEHFIKYAKQNGIWYRGDRSASIENGYNVFKSENERLSNPDDFCQLIVYPRDNNSDLLKDRSFYPYLDTFRTGDEESIKTSSSHRYVEYIYTNTSGQRNPTGYKKGYEYCANDGRYYPREEVFLFSDNWWRKDDNNNVIYCIDTDTYFHRNDSEWRKNRVGIKKDEKIVLALASNEGKTWNICHYSGHRVHCSNLKTVYLKKTGEKVLVPNNLYAHRDYSDEPPNQEQKKEKSPSSHRYVLNNGN